MLLFDHPPTLIHNHLGRRVPVSPIELYPLYIRPTRSGNQSPFRHGRNIRVPTFWLTGSTHRTNLNLCGISNTDRASGSANHLPRGDVFPVHVTAPVPTTHAVVNEGLRLRSVRAELIRSAGPRASERGMICMKSRSFPKSKVMLTGREY